VDKLILQLLYGCGGLLKCLQAADIDRQDVDHSFDQLWNAQQLQVERRIISYGELYEVYNSAIR